MNFLNPVHKVSNTSENGRQIDLATTIASPRNNTNLFPMAVIVTEHERSTTVTLQKQIIVRNLFSSLHDIIVITYMARRFPFFARAQHCFGDGIRGIGIFLFIIT